MSLEVSICPISEVVHVRTRKFMQTLDSKLYLELERIARKRGITVQQLLRAVVVPEWYRDEFSEKPGEKYKGTVRHRRGRVRRLAPRISA